MASDTQSSSTTQREQPTRLSFDPEDMEQVLCWLCSGARYEKKIHLNCHIFDTLGNPRELPLAIPDPYLDPFCERAAGLPGAAAICRDWHRGMCLACRESAPFKTEVVECPFGFSLLVAPVVHGNAVKALLFAGNWREVGAEGLMFRRLSGAILPLKEKQELEEVLLNPDETERELFLLHERVDELKAKLDEVVGEISRLIHLIYLREQAVRELALSEAILGQLALLSASNLHQACQGLGRLLGALQDTLGVQYLVFFTNTGIHDRLEACAAKGINRHLWEGHYLDGAPATLVQNAHLVEFQDQDGCAEWFASILKRLNGKTVLPALRHIEHALPIQLGISSCGVLVFGPSERNQSATQTTMDMEDRRRMLSVARNYLSNGLKEMAERQDLAKVLVTFAHILRGPLMPLQGAIDCLRSSAQSKTCDEKTLIDICNDVDTYIHDLTQQADMFEQANITGFVEFPKPDFKSAPLGVLVNNVWEGMAQWAIRRGIRATGFHTLRDMPDVEMDWNQMRAVLANLLHNAVKYSHNNKDIVLSAEEVDLNGKPGIQFCVADFGTGIDPGEIEKKIYEPGFRGSIRDEKRHVEGAGMGLTVCRQVVETLHHGKIYARCTEKHGIPNSFQHCLVEFFIELPLQQE